VCRCGCRGLREEWTGERRRWTPTRPSYKAAASHTAVSSQGESDMTGDGGCGALHGRIVHCFLAGRHSAFTVAWRDWLGHVGYTPSQAAPMPLHTNAFDLHIIMRSTSEYQPSCHTLCMSTTFNLTIAVYLPFRVFQFPVFFRTVLRTFFVTGTPNDFTGYKQSSIRNDNLNWNHYWNHMISYYFNVILFF